MRVAAAVANKSPAAVPVLIEAINVINAKRKTAHFGFFRPWRLIMSNDPAAPPRGNKVRWIITGGLLILAVLCVGWIVSLTLSGEGWGTPFVAEGSLFLPIAALDVLALIGLGVWVLRPPAPGALGFFGRWLGKVLLFLGLGVAIVVFFFATCLAVPAIR